jgi:glycine/D-amino acid oxidase-like deaminating enzyme
MTGEVAMSTAATEGAPSARGRLDLHSDQAYWLLRDGIGDTEPRLLGAHTADAVVIGAGITGALMARLLAAAGLQVVVVDQRSSGLGSTTASTALLQYEIDTHLVDLIGRLGTERAGLAYQVGVEAIDEIRAIAAGVGADVGYQECDSLYLANTRDAVTTLRAELEARQRLGIDAEWLTEKYLLDRYECSAPGAILSHLAGVLNPVAMTRALLRHARNHGAELFARTRVTTLSPRGSRVRVATASGASISTDFVVICGGYESLSFLPPGVAELHSSFALTSEPVDSLAPGFINTVFWETARPYLYGRATPDGRYILGGEDIASARPEVRDRALGAKIQSVIAKSKQYFPLLDVRPEYTWAGTFGETPDGLPYIGPFPGGPPNVLFALCFGGNGISYSVKAATMTYDRILGRKNALDELFGFSRADEDTRRPAA